MTRKQITEPREDQLIRAAKIRAAVTSYLANQTAPVTKAQIETDLSNELKEIGCDTHALAYQLKYLVQGERIKRVEDAGSKPMFHALDHIPTKPPKLGVTVLTKAPPKPTSGKSSPQMQHQNQQTMQHHMSIDMVKSTGRVRISTQGMILEIGVVDN